MDAPKQAHTLKLSETDLSSLGWLLNILQQR